MSSVVQQRVLPFEALRIQSVERPDTHVTILPMIIIEVVVIHVVVVAAVGRLHLHVGLVA